MSRPFAVKGGGACPSMFSTPGYPARPSGLAHVSRRSPRRTDRTSGSDRFPAPGRHRQAPILNPSLPQESFVPEEESLPPGDVVAEADWRDGIEQLYRHRAAALIQYFAGETRDRDGARDLVHEAFSRLAALGSARRHAVTRPDSYLFRICLNLFHDSRRSLVRQRMLDEEALSWTTLHNPIVQLESRDHLRRLEKAMLGLKPKTRAIFLARRLDGLSYGEIAERTGLSVKGVEKQMAKAIATIDRLMERERS